MMLFSIPIYTFFETRVLFNDISFIIRHYFSYIFSIFVVYLLYHIRLIRLSGDIELNPGPKPSSFKCFSICHWNLNSITSHDFLKVKLLTAYNVMRKFDIICISESYLNSDTSPKDNNLNYLVICSVLIILPEIGVGEFAYIIRCLCLLKC